MNMVEVKVYGRVVCEECGTRIVLELGDPATVVKAYAEDAMGEHWFLPKKLLRKGTPQDCPGTLRFTGEIF